VQPHKSYKREHQPNIKKSLQKKRSSKLLLFTFPSCVIRTKDGGSPYKQILITMWACTATLRRHQLVSVSPTFASEQNFKFLPILLQHQTTHTHTHTTTTTTTRQIQEAYDQANQSPPKTLYTNPSQKQIPTAIGEKPKKKQTKNKKTREPSKQPSTNSVQQRYSNQSSSSLCVPQNTPHTYHRGTCLRNPRNGKHTTEKTDPKKKNQPTSPKLLPLINKAPETDYHGKKFHGKKKPNHVKQQQQI